MHISSAHTLERCCRCVVNPVWRGRHCREIFALSEVVLGEIVALVRNRAAVRAVCGRGGDHAEASR